MMQLYIGILAGLFSLGGYVPYVLDIIHGKSKPERAAWLIWTLSTSLIFLSYVELGAFNTLWLPLAYLIGTGTVTVLSFIYGRDGWGFLERIVLVVAVISAIRWIFFENVLFTLLINLFVAFIGYTTRIRELLKGTVRHEEIDLATWGIYSLGAFFNLFAITEWSAQISTLPIIYFAMNGITFALIIMHKAKTAQEVKEAK